LLWSAAGFLLRPTRRLSPQNILILTRLSW